MTIKDNVAGNSCSVLKIGEFLVGVIRAKA